MTTEICNHAECLSCGWYGEVANLISELETPLKEHCPLCNGTDTNYMTDAEFKTVVEAVGPHPGIDRPIGFVPAGDPPKGNGRHFTPCHATHPALVLESLSFGTGADAVIYGGSCINPNKTDCDIYIGLDYGMKFTSRSFPWAQGEEFLYAIPDMGVPKKPQNFIKMVEWVAERISEGLSVHVGCIGGHGRTGMFLAALVAHMEVAEDAVGYVRENYCKKAVESKTQVNFLMKHFGVSWAAPKKSKGGGEKTVTANDKTGDIIHMGETVPFQTSAGKQWSEMMDDWKKKNK